MPAREIASEINGWEVMQNAHFTSQVPDRNNQCNNKCIQAGNKIKTRVGTRLTVKLETREFLTLLRGSLRLSRFLCIYVSLTRR